MRPEGQALGGNPVFMSDTLKAIAAAHGQAPEWSVARVVMDWQIQRKVGVVPRSARPANVQANAALLRGPASADGHRQLALELTEAELASIDGMDGTMPAVLAAAKKLPPKPPSDDVHAVFKNEFSEPVTVFWEGHDGAVDQGTVAVGQQQAVSTFHGHRWTFKTSDGRPVGEVQIEKGKGQRQTFGIGQGEL